MIIPSQLSINSVKDIEDLDNKELRKLFSKITPTYKNNFYHFLNKVNENKLQEISILKNSLTQENKICKILLKKLWNLLDLDREEKNELSSVFREISDSIDDSSQ